MLEAEKKQLLVADMGPGRHLGGYALSRIVGGPVEKTCGYGRGDVGRCWREGM